MADVTLVTGGSGAVGRAIVRRLRQDDQSVAFIFKSNQKAAMSLAEETGAHPFQTDLTNQKQVTSCVEQISNSLGLINILINNAGFTQIMPFALIGEEDWDSVIEANLKTMFLVTHEVVRGMIARKKGVIVNIGSLAGHRLLDVPVHYATAKAGVSGFTLALAKELSRYNIRVNSAVPGLLNAGVGKKVPEKELAEYLKYCAAGRPGKPEEVAELVAFLASERSSYINAQNIFIDGGI